MSIREPPPPGESSPVENIDLFLEDCIEDLGLDIAADFKCVDEIGTVGGEQSDGYDTDKTADFEDEYIRKKKIKTERRSHSNSPPVSTSRRSPIVPPATEAVEEMDVKPDVSKLQAKLQKVAEPLRIKRSRSPTRSHRSPRRSRDREDRKPFANGRRRRTRSRSISPVRTSRQKSVEAKRPPAARRRTPDRHQRSPPSDYRRSNRRSRSPSVHRDRKRSPERRRSSERRRSPDRHSTKRHRDRSPALERPQRSKPSFLDELVAGGLYSKDHIASVTFDPELVRKPVLSPPRMVVGTPQMMQTFNPAAVQMNMINPAAVQMPMIGVNPMAPPSSSFYGPNMHIPQQQQFDPNYRQAPVYMHPQMMPNPEAMLKEQQRLLELQQLEARRIERQHIAMEETRRVRPSAEPVIDVQEITTDLFLSNRIGLSDFLQTKVKGQAGASSFTTRKTKVLSRCREAIKALERQENNIYNPKFLQIPITDPPEFVKITGRSPLIVNRNNVLFRSTSISDNVDYSQPFKNIGFKIGSIIKAVNLDPSDISMKIQNREDEDRRIRENRVRAIKAENETSMVRNEIGVQTDEIKCERCMIQDLKTYRSTATQKTIGQADFATQTSDMLAVQNSVASFTPSQLRTIDELMRMIQGNTTNDKLLTFLIRSFGEQNQHNWQQIIRDNEHLTHPGRRAFEEDHNVDFDDIIRSVPSSGIPPVGFRDAPQPPIRNAGTGMRPHAGSSNLHNMLNQMNQNKQQYRRFNNNGPNNRFL